MILFIDCEWNGYGGDLISMALVSEQGHEWYEVLEVGSPEPWIIENVIPKLGKTHIGYGEFQYSLQLWLSQFEEIHVIADWPEDIERFCNALITGPGTRINTPPLSMQIMRCDSVSQNPHNALADARGIRDWFANGN